MHHKLLKQAFLREEDARRVLQHIADLWGYEVVLREIDPTSDTVLKEHTSEARPVFF
jgi:spore cortex formation protein SpoVR/YcgB (stage V sporulation)